MALHLAILAAGARGHRKRHGNSRAQRRLRPVRPNFRAELRYRAGLLQLVARCRELADGALKSIEAHWPRPTTGDSIQVIDAIPASLAEEIKRAAAKLGNLDAWAKRLVGISVEANRDSVDTRLAQVIREAIGVDVAGLLRANGPLLQSMRVATADNIALIKSIPEQYFDRVTETVTGGWVEGMRWESLVEQIQHDGDVTENRAKLIARDQTAKINSAFNQERQQQVGIEKYEWQTSGDERVRESHAEVDGKIFEWGEAGPVAGSVNGEPCHPGEDIQCLPGESVLSPSARVLKAYRRRYTGELTTLVCDSGETVSATPNHPVLTRRGWIPIQFVDVGEDVSQAAGEGFEFPVSNPQDVQTTTLEFFSALESLGVCHRVAGTASGFHGDGSDQEVDVVDVDWSLGDKLDPALSKEFCQHILAGADDPGLACGPFDLLFGSSLLAADSVVRSASKSLSSLWAGLRHAGEHALAAIARLDSLAVKVVADGSSLDAKMFRELLHAHTSPEERDRFIMRVLFGVVCRAIDPAHLEATPPEFDAEVVGVDVQRAGDLTQTHPLLHHPVRVVNKRVSENTSGHVFNLQTVTGWYVAQSLLVRNCRCVAIPVVNMEALELNLGQQEQEREAA